jgi:hypothetical protein
MDFAQILLSGPDLQLPVGGSPSSRTSTPASLPARGRVLVPTRARIRCRPRTSPGRSTTKYGPSFGRTNGERTGDDLPLERHVHRSASLFAVGTSRWETGFVRVRTPQRDRGLSTHRQARRCSRAREVRRPGELQTAANGRPPLPTATTARRHGPCLQLHTRIARRGSQTTRRSRPEDSRSLDRPSAYLYAQDHHDPPHLPSCARRVDEARARTGATTRRRPQAYLAPVPPPPLPIAIRTGRCTTYSPRSVSRCGRTGRIPLSKDFSATARLTRRSRPSRTTIPARRRRLLGLPREPEPGPVRRARRDAPTPRARRARLTRAVDPSCASCHDDWNTGVPSSRTLRRRDVRAGRQQPLQGVPTARSTRTARCGGLTVDGSHRHPLLVSLVNRAALLDHVGREAGTSDGDGTVDPARRSRSFFTMDRRRRRAVPGLSGALGAVVSGRPRTGTPAPRRAVPEASGRYAAFTIPAPECASSELCRPLDRGSGRRLHDGGGSAPHVSGALTTCACAPRSRAPRARSRTAAGRSELRRRRRRDRVRTRDYVVVDDGTGVEDTRASSSSTAIACGFRARARAYAASLSEIHVAGAPIQGVTLTRSSPASTTRSSPRPGRSRR